MENASNNREKCIYFMIKWLNVLIILSIILAYKIDHDRAILADLSKKSQGHILPKPKSTEIFAAQENLKNETSIEVQIEYSSFNLTKLLEQLERGNQRAAAIKDKEIILYLGPTGVGKSLSIYYLQGIALKKSENKYNIANEQEQIPGLVIGIRAQSETISINEIKVKDEQQLYHLDTPGFFDNRENDQELRISNPVSITNALKKAKSVRPVLLLSYARLSLDTDIKEIYKYFREIFDTVLVLVQDFDEKLLDKFQIIFTHANSNPDFQKVKRNLNDIIVDMPNNTNLARVLQYIVREIESNNIHFIQLNDLSLQEQSREKILKSIKLKTPITREKNRFQYLFSEDALHLLDKFAMESRAIIQKSVIYKNFDTVIKVLNDQQQLQKYIANDSLEEAQSKSLEVIHQHTKQQLKQVHSEIENRLNQFQLIDQETISSIKQLLVQLEIWELIQVNYEEQLSKLQLGAIFSQQDFLHFYYDQIGGFYATAQQQAFSKEKIQSLCYLSEIIRQFQEFSADFSDLQSAIKENLSKDLQVKTEELQQEISDFFQYQQQSDQRPILQRKKQLKKIHQLLEQNHFIENIAKKIYENEKGELSYMHQNISQAFQDRLNELKRSLDQFFQNIGEKLKVIKDKQLDIQLPFNKIADQTLFDLLTSRALIENECQADSLKAFKEQFEQSIDKTAAGVDQILELMINSVSNLDKTNLKSLIQFVDQIRKADSGIQESTFTNYFKLKSLIIRTAQDIVDQIQISLANIGMDAKIRPSIGNEVLNKLDLLKGYAWVDQLDDTTSIQQQYDSSIQIIEATLDSHIFQIMQAQQNLEQEQVSWAQFWHEIKQTFFGMKKFLIFGSHIQNLGIRFSKSLAQLQKELKQLQSEIEEVAAYLQKEDFILKQGELNQIDQLLQILKDLKSLQEYQQFQDLFKINIGQIFKDNIEKKVAKFKDLASLEDCKIEELGKLQQTMRLVEFLQSQTQQSGTIGRLIQDIVTEVDIKKKISRLAQNMNTKCQKLIDNHQYAEAQQYIQNKMEFVELNLLSEFNYITLKEDIFFYKQQIQQKRDLLEEYLEKRSWRQISSLLQQIKIDNQERFADQQSIIDREYLLSYLDKVKEIYKEYIRQLVECIEQLQQENCKEFSEKIQTIQADCQQIRQHLKRYLDGDLFDFDKEHLALYSKHFHSLMSYYIKQILEIQNNSALLQNYFQIINFSKKNDFLPPKLEREHEKFKQELEQKLSCKIQFSDKSTIEIKQQLGCVCQLKEKMDQAENLFIKNFYQQLHSKASGACKEEYSKLFEHFKRKIIEKDIKSAHITMTQLQMAKDALYEEIPVESEDFSLFINQEENKIRAKLQNLQISYLESEYLKFKEEAGAYSFRAEFFSELQQAFQQSYLQTLENLAQEGRSEELSQKNIKSIILISKKLKYSDHLKDYFNLEACQFSKLQMAESILEKLFIPFLQQLQLQIKDESIDKAQCAVYAEILKSKPLLKSLFQTLEGYSKYQSLVFDVENLFYNFLDNLFASIEKSQKLHSFVQLKKDLDTLQKAELLLTHLLNLSQRELLESEIDERIIGMAQNNKIKSYSQTCKEVDKFLKGIEKQVVNYWENQEFQEFAQLFEQIYEAAEQNISSSLKDISNQFIAKIDNLKQESILYVQKENFLQLQTNIVQLALIQRHSKKDISLIVTKILEEISAEVSAKILNVQGSQIKDAIYRQQQNQHLTEEFFDCFVDQLLKLKQFSENTPYYASRVQQLLNQILNQFESKFKFENILLLYSHLQDRNDILCQEIIDNSAVFQHILSCKFKELSEKTHNQEYISNNLKVLKSDGSFYGVEAAELKNQYQQYQKFYEQALLEHQRKDYDELIKKTRQLVDANKQFLKLERWSDKSREAALKIFSCLSAYWSLQDSNKICPRQLHATQIYAIMLALNLNGNDGILGNVPFMSKVLPDFKTPNVLLQIQTGEGKSIVLGFLSILFSLFGYQVDVSCYSSHLSKRDYDYFADMFQAFKIKEQISYGTFDSLMEKFITSQVDLRQACVNALQGKAADAKENSSQKKVLLLDEVDTFFSEKIVGQQYISQAPYTNHDIQKIVQQIWANRKLDFKQNLKSVLESSEYKLLAGQNQRLQEFYQIQINQMMLGLSLMDQFDDYKVIEDKICYQDFDGYVCDLYKGYVTNFQYLKEIEENRISRSKLSEVSRINLQCGQFSFIEIAKRYDSILGVTGTLQYVPQETRNFLEETYGFTFYKIPSFFGESRLRFDIAAQVRIQSDKNEYFLQIKDVARKANEEDRPVLIFFKNNSILQEYYSSKGYSPAESEKILILNQEVLDKSDIIKRSMRKSQVTLVDRSFGRGTDFKCLNKKICENRGVLVIQTFFSAEVSEEIQIKGRTARQSQEGQYELILLLADLVADLQIQQEEGAQYMLKSSQIYQFLDKKRSQLQHNLFQNLVQVSKQIQDSHEKSQQLVEELIRHNTLLAQNFIIDLNKDSRIDLQKFHFILCLDESGSMMETDRTSNTRWQKVLNAVDIFIENRKALQDLKGFELSDLFTVILYSDKARTIFCNKKLLEAQSEIKQVKPALGRTDFTSAINQINQEIGKNQGQEYQYSILFLSDGQDFNENNAIAALENLIKQRQKAINMWWSLGFGPEVAENNLLQKMAEKMQQAGCEGQYKRAENMQDINQQFYSFAQVIKVTRTGKG